MKTHAKSACVCLCVCKWFSIFGNSDQTNKKKFSFFINFWHWLSLSVCATRGKGNIIYHIPKPSTAALSLALWLVCVASSCCHIYFFLVVFLLFLIFFAVAVIVAIFSGFLLNNWPKLFKPKCYSCCCSYDCCRSCCCSCVYLLLPAFSNIILIYRVEKCLNEQTVYIGRLIIVQKYCISLLLPCSFSFCMNKCA